MSTATMSSKFQITIPAVARAALKLEAGRKLEVIIREDRLELVPVAPMSTFRGFLRGKLPDSEVERDQDRPLVNVLDSSAWLEFFIDGPNSERYAPLAEDTDTLLVPVLCLYEVTRRLQGLGLHAESDLARQLMARGQVVDLTADRAAAAVTLGLAHKLPMADSMIYAIAREFGATLWTQDDDFDGLPGVVYLPKQQP